MTKRPAKDSWNGKLGEKDEGKWQKQKGEKDSTLRLKLWSYRRYIRMYTYQMSINWINYFSLSILQYLHPLNCQLQLKNKRTTTTTKTEKLKRKSIANRQLLLKTTTTNTAMVYPSTEKSVTEMHGQTWRHIQYIKDKKHIKIQTV